MIPLRLLLLEDSQSDAALILHVLRRAGFAVDWRRVETEAEYLAALDPALDLILADYMLPQFDALQALQLTRERGYDIPFIIVSGSIGEGIAVAAMQQGATDYLLKDRLTRLGQAVTQAVEQRSLRREKQRAEQALRESAALHEAVLRSLSAEIAVLDEVGTIITVNDAWIRFAHEHGDPDMTRSGVGVNYLDFCRRGADRFTEADAKSVVGGLQAILDGARSHFTIEYAFNPADEKRWFTIHATALVGRRGVVVAHEEITARKQLEAQYSAVQRMESVGRLAGGVAHDFNNLLTAIGGYAEMSIEALPPDHQARGDLTELRNIVRRAANLTRQLLAFARRQLVEPRLLNLNDLIIETDKLLRHLIGEDIDLITRLEPNLAQIRADPGQIEQVLVNLIVNSRDAMPEGGTIVVETAHASLDHAYARKQPGVAPGEYILLSVGDTGIGMTDEIKQHVFEPFFTTKEAGHGTGLGLATCYGIVKQNGGNIWIYSEVGLGTTVKIYLPRVDEAAEALPARDTIENRGTLDGSETILLVEDEAAVRAVALRALQVHGYRVLEAANGEEALRIAGEHAGRDIQLLITDVVMPKIDGKALADAIRALYPNTKVLFISGYADSVIIQRGLFFPHFELLQKPFSPQQLAQKVRRILDGR